MVAARFVAFGRCAVRRFRSPRADRRVRLAARGPTCSARRTCALYNTLYVRNYLIGSGESRSTKHQRTLHDSTLLSIIVINACDSTEKVAHFASRDRASRLNPPPRAENGLARRRSTHEKIRVGRPLSPRVFRSVRTAQAQVCLALLAQAQVRPARFARPARSDNIEGEPQVYILPHHIYAYGCLPVLSFIKGFRDWQNVHFRYL